MKRYKLRSWNIKIHFRSDHHREFQNNIEGNKEVYSSHGGNHVKCPPFEGILGFVRRMNCICHVQILYEEYPFLQSINKTSKQVSDRLSGTKMIVY